MKWYHSQNMTGKYFWVLVNSDTHNWNDRDDLKLRGAVVVNCLQDALDLIDEDGVIWVIQGVHKPTKVYYDSTQVSGAVYERCRAFDLTDKDGVSIYGGFNGDETIEAINVSGGRIATYSIKDRYTFNYPTVLSGDHTGLDADKSYNILIINVDTGYKNQTIDGITFSGARADNGNVLTGRGAAIYIRSSDIYQSFTGYIKNCRIEGNYANVGNVTGAYFENTLENCLFTNNIGLYPGVCLWMQAVNMNYCSFVDNTNTGYNRGHQFRILGNVSFYNDYRNVLTGCYFKKTNRVSDVESYNNYENSIEIDMRVVFNNCLLVNEVVDVRGVYTSEVDKYIEFNNSTSINTIVKVEETDITSPSSKFINSILDGALVISNKPNTFEFNNSYIGKKLTGTTTIIEQNPITTRPTFIDEANNDYRQQPWSSGVNAGDDSLAYGTEDILGNPRIVQSVDIGCYEKQEIIKAATFNVSDSGGALEGATITIDGISKVLTTDAIGAASINLNDSTTYNYTISKAGYNDTTGTFTLSGSDITINETLTAI